MKIRIEEMERENIEMAKNNHKKLTRKFKEKNRERKEERRFKEKNKYLGFSEEQSLIWFFIMPISYRLIGINKKSKKERGKVNHEKNK